MVQFDPSTGSLVLPIALSATIAAVLVVVTVLAVVRSGAMKTLLTLAGLAVLAYGGWVGWTMLNRTPGSDGFAERRAFDRRVSELAASARMPGSPLACLDGLAGEAIETACEKVLFASSEIVASGVAYVSAQLALLADGLEFAARGDASFEPTLAVLRRGLEADRYGIVAHVLLQRENCSIEQCEMLSLLNDPNRVRSNLQEKPFDVLVAKYAPNWNAQNGRPGAAPLAESQRAAPGMAAGPAGAPVASKYDFPSSSSIPPVSIMNPEPSAPAAAPSAPPAPAASSATAPSAAVTRAPVPPRRPPAARSPVARAAPASPPAQSAVPPASEPSPRQPAQ